MACCGPNIQFTNGRKKLEALQNFKNKNINIKLNPNIKLEFNPETGHWRKNFEDISLSNQIGNDEKYNDLEEKILKQKIEIDSLQKKYLEKLAKLLLMTQSHCQIKDTILESFEKNLSIPKEEILNENMNVKYNTRIKTISEQDVNVNQFYEEPEPKVLKGSEMVPTN
jgi:hypothetical protein